MTDSSPQTPAKQPKKGGVHLTFDGAALTLTCDAEEYVYPAVTGKRGLFASIPEGMYWIRPSELWLCTWLRPLYHPSQGIGNQKSIFNMPAEEKMRITLHPAPASGLQESQCFYIGGGTEDVKSCIYLSTHFHVLVGELKLLSNLHNLQEISLIVAYEHKEEESQPASTQNVVPNLNLERLKGHVPDKVIAELKKSAHRFGITNNLRLAHFLAQCCHESAGFKLTVENLNYSEKGLVKIFPKYFLRRGKSAKDYARKPESIASLVYASRMGNSDEASGDGYKFRGRGYIQLTGKANYHAFAKFIGDDRIVSQPDLVATHYPLASAAFFFQSNGLWSITDRGHSETVITSVTKRVNGGTIGLLDRVNHFKKFFKLLHDV